MAQQENYHRRACHLLPILPLLLLLQQLQQHGSCMAMDHSNSITASFSVMNECGQAAGLRCTTDSPHQDSGDVNLESGGYYSWSFGLTSDGSKASCKAKCLGKSWSWHSWIYSLTQKAKGQSIAWTLKKDGAYYQNAEGGWTKYPN
ncbi:hypothetical protein O6H91_08G104700 [Diphasiastrum complanatum]|uniref:Uncharacterized protein n=1 Tax=Diphasiastrum complanatum TaxID=34168 RepID=A0ACC2D0U0_DIPCM|nr:hypothetical protein O6H91_08G104700 [Diphasiastrum complanatum]